MIALVLFLMLACAVGGYVTRGLVDRYAQARREKVLAALASDETLPEDWEKRARAVEDEADEYEADGYTQIAAGERKRAETIRRIARERLKRGRL